MPRGDSDWTEAEIRRIEQLVTVLAEEREKRLNERSAASKEAIDTATEALESRLNLLNELRGNVVDKQAFDSFIERQDERYGQILAAMAEMRTDLAVGPSAIPALQAHSAERTGATTRTKEIVAYAVAVVTVAVSLTGIIAVILNH